MSRRLLLISMGVFTTVLAAHADAPIPATPRFRYERPITPGAAGPNRLPVDVPLLAGAQRLDVIRAGSAVSGLQDLRFYDPAGREVPYLLIAPPVVVERWVSSRILPVLATKTTSGFEVDLGSANPVDRMRIGGLPAPFLKRVRLEGSGDRSHWTLLVKEGTLFDLPDQHLVGTELAFTEGTYHYFRVTWDDTNSTVLPLPQVVALRRADRAPPPPPANFAVGFQRRPSEPGRSRFRLHLPGPDLPIAALTLACGGGHVLRDARVSEPHLARGEVLPVSLGSHALRRAVRNGLVAEDLRIAITRPQGPDLDLVVDDGDNPPLELRAVSAEFAPLPWIYFESSAGESLTARFGDPRLAAPHYDLEAMRPSMTEVPEPTLAEAQWGERRALPLTEEERASVAGSGLPVTGAEIDRAAFRYVRAIPRGPSGLSALVLDAAVLAHSRDLGDLRVIADGEGRQVPYVMERLDEPLSVELPALQSLAASGKESRYRVVLPYDSLPASRLVLSTTGRIFERRVTLTAERGRADRRSEPRTEVVASAQWRHVDPERLAPELVLGLRPLGVAVVELRIDEGDNSPLPLGRPRLLLPAHRLRFYRTTTEELTLLYGQPTLTAPRYDLALLAPQVLGATAVEIQPAAESTGPAPSAAQGSRLPTRLFWGVLIGAVAVLVGLIARLVKADASR